MYDAAAAATCTQAHTCVHIAIAAAATAAADLRNESDKHVLHNSTHVYASVEQTKCPVICQSVRARRSHTKRNAPEKTQATRPQTQTEQHIINKKEKK